MQKEMNPILAALCEETGTSKEGVQKLVNYYTERCGWTEDSATEYVYELFENGTIDMIKGLGQDDKRPAKAATQHISKSVDSDRLWHEGALRVHSSSFHYWVKQYDTGSEWGINGGRVSKLTIKRDGKEVANYDRGWDIEPGDPDTQLALEILLHEYNQ